MVLWLVFVNINLKCIYYGIFFDKICVYNIVFSLKYIVDIEYNFEME